MHGGNWNPTLATPDYEQVSTIQPGFSYFIYGNGGNLSVSGLETNQTTIDIPLYKGWNMIGNPFRYNVKLSDITVTYSGQTVSLQQAETNGWVVGTVFYKKDNAYQVETVQDGGQIKAWEGYWILSDKTCTLHIPPTPAQ